MFERCWVGAGVLVFDLPPSVFVASGRVVSILCVWVMCPYCWVKVVFKVLCMFGASSRVSYFSLLRGICVDCICGIELLHPIREIMSLAHPFCKAYMYIFYL